METDQPLWTIRPNWRNGVLERLEWLTNVISGETGVEQRRSVRPSPRLLTRTGGGCWPWLLPWLLLVPGARAASTLLVVLLMLLVA